MEIYADLEKFQNACLIVIKDRVKQLLGCGLGTVWCSINAKSDSADAIFGVAEILGFQPDDWDSLIAGADLHGKQLRVWVSKIGIAFEQRKFGVHDTKY